MKQLIDLLPILVFVAIYILGDIYAATAGLMATAILQIIVFKFNGWEISRQLWIVFAVALISGSLTLIFQNKLFIQWKPTIVYWLMGIGLIGSRLVGDGTAIQRSFGKVLELTDHAWQTLTFGWSAVIIIAGFVNLYVAYNFQESAWVTYKLISSLILPVILTVVSFIYLHFANQLPEMGPKSEKHDQQDNSSS